MKGHQQPTGRAQSPLSSAFAIIILLDNFLSSTLKVLVNGHGAQNGSLGELPGFAVKSGTLVLLPGRLCSSSVHGELCAFSSSDDVLVPLAAWHKQYGFLRLANFVTAEIVQLSKMQLN